LTMPVKWHFVADDQSGNVADALFYGWNDTLPDRHAALDRKGLARFTARRAARQEPAADLLPADFAGKYHQQYVDRLWMRGLGAVVALYMVGVLIYMAGLQVLGYQKTKITGEVAGLANSYTNVLRLKERTQILQEQLNLKYAALDCWKVSSELLPADFTLISLQFGRGGTLQLSGTAPPGAEQKVIDYNEAMRDVTINGKRVFRSVTPPTTQSRTAQFMNWNFECSLDVSAPL
ncbi:MAG: hypothetical protein ACXW32_10470, partial [Limisphaerales bacterium]